MLFVLFKVMRNYWEDVGELRWVFYMSMVVKVSARSLTDTTGFVAAFAEGREVFL